MTNEMQMAETAIETTRIAMDAAAVAAMASKKSGKSDAEIDTLFAVYHTATKAHSKAISKADRLIKAGR